jgi:GNAT superfamily N-acetyltransferase
MSIEVRQADLRLDRASLVEALKKWLTPTSNDHRFDWLYTKNPYGPARAWLAVTERDGFVVGAAAAFPRRVLVGGSEIPACVYGDFCVAPEHRSLGLALRLQRACLESTESGWAEIAYDFPSASMMAIYKRMGVGNHRTMTRFAKPLRANRKIREKLKYEPVVRAVSVVANKALEMHDRASLRESRWDIAAQQDTCGEEFTVLADEIGSASGNCVVRTAAYLNWRFLFHPHCRYEILTAHREGRLRGYLVFCENAGDGTIADLFGVEDEEMFASLLGAASEILRARAVITVNAPLLDGHPRSSSVEKAGFRRRESCDVILLEGSNRATSAVSGAWYLMDGDRDS